MSALPPHSPQRDTIVTLSKVLLGAFLLVGVSLLFWGVVRAAALQARDDNPRVLEAEARVQRGALLDRAGAVFAENTGSPQRQVRLYPLPEGAHAVGFYSRLHGTAGAEAAFDPELRGETGEFLGEWWRDTLHLPRAGHDVRLALDHALQETAVSGLGDQVGAALLLEIPRDEDEPAWIRAMISRPGYDANVLDETFEALSADPGAPLLNRVTQGQYQPGLLLQPYILAWAVENGVVRLDDPVSDAARPVAINGQVLTCATPPPNPASWADVLDHRCPGPMQDLADRLGRGGLDAAFDAFGLTRDPALELATETTADEPLADALLAGIGQENLSLTPLQIGLATGALAAQGVVPQAQLAEAIGDGTGRWQPWRLSDRSARAVSPGTARAMRRALPPAGELLEFSSLVLSGPQGSTNAWYTGIAAGEDADYVAVIVLENAAALDRAQAAGRGLLEAVD